MKRKCVVSQVMKSWALRMKNVFANKVGKRMLMLIGIASYCGSVCPNTCQFKKT